MPGPTNCEKTTLMRAVSQEKVDGFFKHDELVTIFVEHDVEEREIEPSSAAWPLGKMNNDLNGIEFVVDTCNNIYQMYQPLYTTIYLHINELFEQCMSELFEEIVAQKCPVNAVLCTTMTKGFAKARPVLITFSALVKVNCDAARMMSATWLLADMNQRGLVPDEAIYTKTLSLIFVLSMALCRRPGP